ncbi:hypothetical protein LG634_24535 [Streptomyces bambusae]|uniref:hypothetical protein n=1 Tax=Streptomyces bambusae TaxID=1550616 RepID=UPI001CFE8D41|nr:hypothetical protein [Streptomyces bambusae]MCB5167982.1 hypothetical protein [Streptomyces bambusae]
MADLPKSGPSAPPSDPSGTRRPQRGDLATDTSTGRTGVIVSLPEDSGTQVFHLRPEGGGPDWSAHAESLLVTSDSR